MRVHRTGARVLGCLAPIAALLLGVLYFGAADSVKASNLVLNGDFESTSGVTAANGSFFLGNGEGALNNWFLGTPKGISNEILFASGTADMAGATRSDGVQFGLWGPGNGVFNGLPASSPSGGNFVALDGDTSANVSLNQTITGLTVGTQYTVDFEWAASQYRFINNPPNFTGATGDSFQASLARSDRPPSRLTSAAGLDNVPQPRLHGGCQLFART